MSGATFQATMKTLFVSQGENEQLATYRKVEQAQKAAATAADKTSDSQKKAGDAAEKSSSSNKTLHSTMGELAASQKKQAKESLAAADAARKQAQAADLSTKEGRKYAREQNAVATSHDRAAKSSLQASTALEKQEAATEKASRSTKELGTSLRSTAKEAAKAGAGAAWEKQKKSLSGLVTFAKRATLVTGGLAAAGVVAGIKLNASWESQQASFATLLGSMDKATKFTENLRKVSAESPLRLTEYAEGAKLLLGFGTEAKKVVPVLSAVNKAVVATGQGEEAMMSITRALGLIQGRGKATAKELNMLVTANVPVQKILQKQLGLTGDQVANIGKEGIAADKVISAISKGWTREYGPAYENASKTWVVQTAKLKKGFEQMLRVSTGPLFDKLTEIVLPGMNTELEKAVKIIDNPRLSGTEKLDRLGNNFDRVADKVGAFAERAVPKVAEAMDRMLPRATAILEKITPIVATVLGKAFEAAIPLAVKGGGQIVGALAKGFMQADTWGRLLVGGWLFTKLGGVAAIRAAGFSVGSQMGAGVGQGVAAGTVAGGGMGAAGAAGAAGVAAKAAGVAKGVGKIGLWGAAITAGIDSADILINNSADNLMSRLDQIDSHGKGMMGTIDRVVGVIPEGIFGMEEGNSISHLGDRAHDLKAILEEINDVGRARAVQLKEEARAKAESLDLTKQEKVELDKALATPTKATAQNNAIAGMDDLNSGVIARAEDIAKKVKRTQANINAGWAKGSKSWRKKTAQNMNAQVKAINSGMNKSVISTDRGQARIKQILRQKQLMTGKDPAGIAAGFARSWKRTHKITSKQLNRYKRDLAQMPKDSREKAIDSMEAMAQGLVKKGKLPEKELIKLQSALTGRFGKTGKQTSEGFTTGLKTGFSGLKSIVPKALGDVKSGITDGLKKATTAAETGAKKTGKPFKTLADSIGRYAGRSKRSITDIPGPMRDAFTIMMEDANTASASFGSSKTVSMNFKALRAGGLVKRFQDGGLMPAAVSSGELLRFPGGNWATVPGRPVAADNVLTALPADTEVYTGHGQGLLAAGASRTQALAEQVPHFREGGKVRKGVLSGGAEVGRAAGQKGIDGAHTAAKKWVNKQEMAAAANVAGKGIDGLVPQVKRALGFAQAHGWGGSVTSGFRSYAEQAVLYAKYLNGTGNLAARPGSSNHEGGQAVDISDTESFAGAMDQMGRGRLYRRIPGEPWHFSVTGYRGGGRVPQKFRKGGKPVRVGYTVYNDPPPGAYSTGLNKGYAELGTAKRTDGSGTGRGWIAAALGRRGELPQNFPLTVKIGGKKRTLYKKDRGYGQGGNGVTSDKSYALDLWKDSWGHFGLNANSKGQALVAAGKNADMSGKTSGNPARSKTRKVTKITDDLKPLGVRAARRAMPNLQRGHQRDAFSSAFDAGRAPGSIARNATAAARVKITKSTKTVKAGAGTSGGGRKNNTQTRVRKMQAFGDRVSGRKMPYQYGGGHSKLGVGNPSFDCSGYVSGILGAGGFINQPMTVAQGTGLYTLGKSGSGKQVTWGVRGTSAQNAHTMVRVGKKYYESGSGHGPRRVDKWSGQFQKRHIKGYGGGGLVGSTFRPERPKRGRRPKFGTGRDAAYMIDGIGRGTGSQMKKLYTAGSRDNKRVKAALEALGRTLSRAGQYSVGSLVRLQKQTAKVIKRTIHPKSPGGRKITKAETAIIRRARSVIDLTQAALGAKAGKHFRRAEKIGKKLDQRTFDRALKARRRGIDSGTPEGVEFEMRTAAIEKTARKRQRKQLKKALRIATKAGAGKKAREIREQLQETSNAIAEAAVTQIELMRQFVLAKIDETRTDASWLAGGRGLFDRQLAATQRLENRENTPESTAQSANAIGARIRDLKREQEQEWVNFMTLTAAGLEREAQDAFTAWKEAEVAGLEAMADQADLRRQAALGAAQRTTDQAGHTAGIQSIFYERLQLEQQLAGTHDTGNFARRDFILANVVPALTTELAAMEEQLSVIVTHGDDEQTRQQTQAIEQKRNEILQAQLEAQEEIKKNTDPKGIGGTIGFSFGGENLTDQLMLDGNGV